MSALLLSVVILFVVLNELHSFSASKFRFSSIIQRRSAGHSLKPHDFKLAASEIGQEVDISPNKDRGIVKTLLREGDLSRKRPIAGDSVEIFFKLFDMTTTPETLIHDSRNGPKNGGRKEGIYQVDPVNNPARMQVYRDLYSITFALLSDPPEVMKSWDIAVETMRLGEVSSFVMEPAWAFAGRGLRDQIGPNAKVRFELELAKIEPHWSTAYEKMKEGESIKEQHDKDLESGASPLSASVFSKKDAQRAFGSEGRSFGFGAPASGQAKEGETIPNSARTTSAASSTSPSTSAPADEYLLPKYNIKTPHIRVTEPPPPEALMKPDGTKRTFYDPERHNLDTTAEVSGQADGYQWRESFNTMDVEIPLQLPTNLNNPVRLSKKDVLVDIGTSSINVRHLDGRPLLVGPLQGKIVADETSWALADYGIADTYKYKAFQCLQISLIKSAMYRDIWATVLNRDWLQAQLPPGELERRRAEFDMYERRPPGREAPAPVNAVTGSRPLDSSQSAAKLNSNEELSYLDFDMDEQGNVVGESTHKATNDEAAHYK